LAASLLQKEVDSDHSKDDFALGFDWADVRDDADEGMDIPFQASIQIHNNLQTPW
jgi:hypothetical protein